MGKTQPNEQPRAQGMKQMAFLHPDGGEMAGEPWNATEHRCFGVLVSSAADGSAETATLAFLINARTEPVPFRLPDPPSGFTWECLLNTALEQNISSFQFTSGQLAAARETVMSQGDQPMGMGARGGVAGSEYAGQEGPGDILIVDLDAGSLAIFKMKPLETSTPRSK